MSNLRWQLAVQTAQAAGHVIRAIPQPLRSKLAQQPWFKLRFAKGGTLVFIAFDVALRDYPNSLPVIRQGVHLNHTTIPVKMPLDLQHYIDRRYYFTHEDNVVGTFLHQHLAKTDVYFDIGASIGHTTIIAAATNASVFAFEPETQAFAQLQRTLKANNFSNVTIYNLAASDTQQEKQLHISTNNEGSHTLDSEFKTRVGNQYNSTQTISTVPLNDLELPYPKIIKIDVEGHEISALRGMTKYLPRTQYCICETMPHRLPELQSFMTSFGFKEHQVLDKSRGEFVPLPDGLPQLNKRLIDMLFINHRLHS